MRTRIAIVVGGLVAISIVLIAWRLRDDRPTRRQRTAPSRLDVAAFRTQLALRVKRAKEIARRPPPPAAPALPAPAPRSKAWEQRGQGPLKGVKDLIHENGQCWAGPTALCDALQPLATACSEGDARSCIAIGQYLAETPPRTLLASAFFHSACRIGDEEACARLDALEPGSPIPCEEDPFACSWRAVKTQDTELHEEACSLGAAESCSMVAFAEPDGDKRLALYETSCQLGHTLACDLLVLLVAPDCEDGGADVCLPIDHEAGERAKTIACEAGFMQHC